MKLPTIERFSDANRSLLWAIRLPLFRATREFIESPYRVAPWYRVADYDSDCDVYLYALLPLVPFVRVWAFWRRHRWIVERTLRHRIFIVGEGYHSSEWKLAPLRKWGWKRDWRRMASP